MAAPEGFNPMTYQVYLSKHAQEALRSVPQGPKEKIAAAIDRLSSDPFDEGYPVESLTQSGDEIRVLRVDGWRVIFRVAKEVSAIILTTVYREQKKRKGERPLEE